MVGGDTQEEGRDLVPFLRLPKGAINNCLGALGMKS